MEPAALDAATIGDAEDFESAVGGKVSLISVHFPAYNLHLHPNIEPALLHAVTLSGNAEDFEAAVGGKVPQAGGLLQVASTGDRKAEPQGQLYKKDKGGKQKERAGKGGRGGRDGPRDKGRPSKKAKSG